MALSKERRDEIAWGCLVLIARKEPLRAIVEFQHELRGIMDIPRIEVNFTRLIFNEVVIKKAKKTSFAMMKEINIFDVKSVAWTIFIAWKVNTERRVIVKNKDKRKVLGMSTKEAIEFAKLANEEIRRRHLDTTSIVQVESV